MTGTVYTETLVHMAPPQFADSVPYQVVIVTLEDGRRLTGRVAGDRVAIDDRVVLKEYRNGVPFFARQPAAEPL